MDTATDQYLELLNYLLEGSPVRAEIISDMITKIEFEKRVSYSEI